MALVNQIPVEKPFMYEGLDIMPFVNKLDASTADLVDRCRAAPRFAEDLGTGIRLPTIGFMNQYIDDYVLVLLAERGYGGRLYNLELSMREAISNYIRHPTRVGKPFRPVVDLHLLRDKEDFALVTITNEDPAYDPRKCKWQFEVDPARLLEPNGRGALLLRYYADFAAFARSPGDPWQQYVLVRLEAPKPLNTHVLQETV